MRAGKLSRAVLDRSVYRQITLSGAADRQTERGTFDEMPFSDPAVPDCLESHVCGTLEEPGGLTGSMLLGLALNQLYAGAGTPCSVSFSLVFPENEDEAVLKALMRELGESASGEKLVICGGHTQVSSAVSRPVLSLHVLSRRNRDVLIENPERPLLGLSLVMAGTAGAAGAARIAKAHSQKLRERFPDDLIDSCIREGEHLLIKNAAAIALSCGCTRMYPVSWGGVFGALWEMGEKYKTGLTADLRAIPIRQETVEICESFDCNPYQLFGQGALLIAADEGELLCEKLAEEHIPAGVIGCFDSGSQRIIQNGEEKRFLEKPQQDAWYKAL